LRPCVKGVLVTPDDVLASGRVEIEASWRAIETRDELEFVPARRSELVDHDSGIGIRAQVGVHRASPLENVVAFGRGSWYRAGRDGTRTDHSRNGAFHGTLTSSTRRLRARPSGVSLVSRGLDLP